ncbi:ATP-binding cassette domain-containing protein [Kineococcus rubinsiae]|uniref:ATP-binding cassette domain-containing protein n=1 Tax=Kineococcus rubinsiae TaxID=2609562 RepID=UPI001430A51B|nr:ATP-binding cassette domain-containing protein [Kineococcus rubinsiae]NIZ91942.1 ATP-binding cassette domain-containing protein [Kineococcus rubinsiae]
MPAITLDALTRRFGERTAVNALTVDVPQGGVVGLVGPNGSGKSTLLRMLLGLVRPTSGQATVLGHPISAPARYLGRVGALVESPAFVPGLSARANLLSLAHLRGLPARRVDEVLETVGLTGRQREPVKRFSLGMKQRLGIAAALLPDPDLLLLDEPTNGLDPAGIVEVRRLLRDLGSSGRTVLVSSHLLAEIEAACDSLVVIRFGDLVYDGPTAGLLARGTSHVDVLPEHEADTAALQAVLRAAGWDVAATPAGVRVEGPDGVDGAAVNRAAAAGGVVLRSIVATRDSLEHVFLALTGSSDGELAAARTQAAPTTTPAPRSRR